MMGKIIFGLMILCVLAVPASAVEISGPSYSYVSDVGGVIRRTNGGAGPMLDQLTIDSVSLGNNTVKIFNADPIHLLVVRSSPGVTIDGSPDTFVMVGPGQLATITGLDYQVFDFTGAFFTISKPDRARLGMRSGQTGNLPPFFFYLDNRITSGPDRTCDDKWPGVTPGTAFCTLQAAWDFVYGRIDTNRQAVTFRLECNDKKPYSPGLTAINPLVGQGIEFVTVTGCDGISFNTVIEDNANGGIFAGAYALIYAKNLSVRSTGQSVPFQAAYWSLLTLDNVAVLSAPGTAIFAFQYGRVEINSPWALAHSGQIALAAASFGSVYVAGPATGYLYGGSFPYGFAYVASRGTIAFGNSWAGNISGPRFSGQGGGSITASTSIPGTSAGNLTAEAWCNNVQGPGTGGC